MRTFSFARIFPAPVSGDTADGTVVVPAPAVPGNNELRGIELSFTPQVDATVGTVLHFPDPAALRGADGNLQGFAVPGDATTAGWGEVRTHAPRTEGGFEAVGTVVPCTVAYLTDYGPSDLIEQPSRDIRLALAPVNAHAPGRALWPPGYAVRLTLAKYLPTTSIDYA